MTTRSPWLILDNGSAIRSKEVTKLYYRSPLKKEAPFEVYAVTADNCYLVCKLAHEQQARAAVRQLTENLA